MSALALNQYWFRLFVLGTSLLGLSLSVSRVAAQDRAAPTWEIFTGYSYAHPGGTVILPLNNQPYGFGVSGTRNFNNWFGLTLDVGSHYSGNGTATRKNSKIHTLMVGPKLTYRSEHWAPFAEALVGFNRLSPGGVESDNGVTGNPHTPAFALGGGLDLPLKKYLAVRIVQADYEYGHHDFHGEENSFPVGASLNGTLNGWRIQSGLTWRLGPHEHFLQPTASCSLQPQEVLIGQLITSNVTTSNFPKNHLLSYAWSATGGTLQVNGSSATIDTTQLSAGRYSVLAKVNDPKRKKEGASATCSSDFIVKQVPRHPPVLSCSATPLSVQAGTASIISCDCTSPDNVPVKFGGWTSSAGNLSVENSRATLSTAKTSPGPITVNTTCTDSRDLSASGSTQIIIEPPPSPPPPMQANKLSECQFPNVTKPWRVDNTCKAILDDVAQRLQHDVGSSLVIVGNADTGETRRNLSAERAINAKAYLVGGEAKQAIDPSRVQVRTGSSGTKIAEYWVVPESAVFVGEGTQTVDEKKIKPIPDHPILRKKPSRR